MQSGGKSGRGSSGSGTRRRASPRPSPSRSASARAPGAPRRRAGTPCAGGPHLPHRLQRGGDALRLPALALRRRLAGPGADVAVGVGLETLDNVSVVFKTGAEDVDQECVRRVAWYRHRCAHRASPSCRRWGTAATPPSGTPTAAPLPVRLPSRWRRARSGMVARLRRYRRTGAGTAAGRRCVAERGAGVDGS